MTIDVIFSKKERRSVSKDKQFLNFITANLKPIYPLLSNITCKVICSYIFKLCFSGPVYT